MALQLGYRMPVIPLTRSVFGDKGDVVITGQVQGVQRMMGSLQFWGLRVSTPQPSCSGHITVYHHPELIRQHWNQVGDGTRLQVSLEDGRVVATKLGRDDEPLESGPKFTADPLVFGEVDLGDVLRMYNLVEHLSGGAERTLCKRYKVCRGAKHRGLNWGRTALVIMDGVQSVICCHCMDELLGSGELKAKDVLVDARRIPPYAAVGYGRGRRASGSIPLDLLLHFVDHVDSKIKSVTFMLGRGKTHLSVCSHPECPHGHGESLGWGYMVITAHNRLADQLFCCGCYDRVVRNDNDRSIAFLEGVGVDGRLVRIDQPIPYYNTIPPRVR